MSLIQVVPHALLTPEGVGSYALALGAALARDEGIASRCLAAAALSERSARALAAALAGESTVLLHYANYAYQRRGCPSWLIDGLERWKGEETSRRLVTVFHEVYATGPPWRSSFWLSPRQRQLAARLLRLSNAATTSLELYARILRSWRPQMRIAVQPVFSTIGEPADVPPFAARPRRLLVFGGPGTRQRAYRERAGDLASACRTLAIEEVCDVGPPAGSLPSGVAGVPVRPLGPLPAAEASNLMLRSLAGFLAYPVGFLPKSTVFAAYCAHGLVPVCAGQRNSAHNGAASGLSLWMPEDGRPGELEQLAARAHLWYHEHSLDRQTGLLGSLLEDDSRG